MLSVLCVHIILHLKMSFSLLAPGITSKSALIHSHLLTGGELSDYFLTFGMFTPVYQPDCSSHQRRSTTVVCVNVMLAAKEERWKTRARTRVSREGQVHRQLT